MKTKEILKLLSLILTLSVLVTYFTGCTPANNTESTPNASESTSDIPTVVQPTKRVAFTFDDGPHNVRTKMIVDALAKYDFHATFFVVGNRVDGTEYNGSEALKYTAEAGHEIAVHGYTHSPDRYYDKCSDEIYEFELSETEKAIKYVVKDQNIKLMRPVGGRITDERVQSCKYSVIMWSVDSLDWKYKYTSTDTEAEAAEKIDTIVNNIMSSVKDGSIVLMHDIYESTYDALVIVLERLYAEGYEVVTVSELLGSDLAPGKKYSSKK